jgi:type II secretory pathway pseudopilin PulG
MSVGQLDHRNNLSRQCTRTAPFRGERGWSLLEMAVVLSMILILACITFVTLQGTLKVGKTNTAYNITLRAMRDARQMAIDDWTTYYVTFVAPNTIQVWQQPRGIVGQPLPPAQLKTTYVLPLGGAGAPDIRFDNEPSLPTTTPDGLRSGTFAVDFGQGVGGGGATSVYFYPDGSAHDLAGNINNGVVEIARPGDLYSTRALSIYGTTGRIRGWRLDQGTTSGVNVWNPI